MWTGRTATLATPSATISVRQVAGAALDDHALGRAAVDLLVQVIGDPRERLSQPQPLERREVALPGLLGRGRRAPTRLGAGEAAQHGDVLLGQALGPGEALGGIEPGAHPPQSRMSRARA